jgi:hypothetical protein
LKLVIAIALLTCVSVMAAEMARYRVHYLISGSSHNITVLAESFADARETVMAMFPDAVVTGVHRVGKDR